MHIRLDKKSEAFIARKVQKGEFRDANEATSEAVHRMAEHEEKTRELRAALQIGIDQLKLSASCTLVWILGAPSARCSHKDERAHKKLSSA